MLAGKDKKEWRNLVMIVVSLIEILHSPVNHQIPALIRF